MHLKPRILFTIDFNSRQFCFLFYLFVYFSFLININLMVK